MPRIPSSYKVVLRGQTLPNHGHRVEATHGERELNGESGGAQANLIGGAGTRLGHAILGIRLRILMAKSSLSGAGTSDLQRELVIVRSG